MSTQELVSGRKLEIPLEAFEAVMLAQIRFLKEGVDSGNPVPDASAKINLLANAVRLARECEDLRKGTRKTPTERAREAIVRVLVGVINSHRKKRPDGSLATEFHYSTGWSGADVIGVAMSVAVAHDDIIKPTVNP